MEAKGEWKNEPNREEWRDQVTGLPCIAKRNPLGAWCGYVGVQPGHPAYEKNYDNVDVRVHGGLTYGSLCNGSICHVPLPGESEHTYWFGFDCAHYGDLIPNTPFPHNEGTYRTLNYVKDQCAKLAAQLKEMEHGS